MKLLRETQCHACKNKISSNVIFCRYCKRDRFLGLPQYEWLIIFFILFGCMGSFGIVRAIPSNLLPSATPTASKQVTVAPTVTLIPTKTPIIATLTVTSSATRKPTSTIPESSGTPDYFGGSTCSGAPIVRVKVNDLVIVVTSNSDRLILRSKPIIEKSTELKRLDYGSYLKIHDGPVCVRDASSGKNYWFWEVKDKATGMMGWVADGDSSMHYIKNTK